MDEELKQNEDYIKGYDAGFAHGSRQRWISTKEMPVAPNEDTEYLLCVSGKKGNITYDHAVISEGMVEDGRWYINGMIDHDLEILAWMPYPDGYWGE